MFIDQLVQHNSNCSVSNNETHIKYKIFPQLARLKNILGRHQSVHFSRTKSQFSFNDDS